MSDDEMRVSRGGQSMTEDDPLRDVVDDLRQRVEILESRIDELEASAARPDGTLDRYDATVLDGLDEGETYTLTDFQSAYRQAGIRQQSTLKARIKHLTAEFCDRVGTQRWRFVGRENE